MLLPKRVKYRRVHRGRLTGKAYRGNKVTYGDYGLQAWSAWITSNQIEAARVAMTRYCKRFGKVWIKIFPDKPITQKPAETRMVPVKARPNTGWPSSSPAESCSSSAAFRKRPRARRSAWRATSFRSSASLFLKRRAKSNESF